MNISQLTSTKLRSLASIKEQIETLEQQAVDLVHGSAATAAPDDSATGEPKPAGPVQGSDGRKSRWTPARKRKMREARMRLIARWKRQGRNGCGQLI